MISIPEVKTSDSRRVLSHRVYWGLGICGLSLIVLVCCITAKNTKWRYTSPLRSPRALAPSIKMADGRILFKDDSPSGLEIFDPTTDSWSYPSARPQSLDSIHHQRANLMSASPNFWPNLTNHTVAFSGYIPNGPEGYSNDAAGAPEPIHFRDGSILSIYYDFRLEIPGRKPKYVNTPDAVSSTLLYNLIQFSDERLFFTQQGDLGGAVEAIYSHKKDTWQELNDPFAAVGQTATLLPDGKILVIGGALTNPTFYQRLVSWYEYCFSSTYSTYLDPPSPNTITARCRLYDPVTNTWHLTQSLNQRRAFHTTDLLPDGRILVSGGYISPNDYSITATCEIISLHDIDP